MYTSGYWNCDACGKKMDHEHWVLAKKSDSSLSFCDKCASKIVDCMSDNRSESTFFEKLRKAWREKK